MWKLIRNKLIGLDCIEFGGETELLKSVFEYCGMNTIYSFIHELNPLQVVYLGGVK